MSTNFKKIVASFVLVAIAAFAVKAPTVRAATIEELQALIASLTAQLAALTGGTTTTSCYVHTVTLTQGSTGSQVMAMQAVVGATADGKFGPMTKAKVMAWQASKGLVADGVVGPMTGAAMAASCVPSTGNTGNTGSTGNANLSGGAGSVDEYKLLSTPSNNEEVGEGENNVKVLGFSVEADDNSDLKVVAVRVDFGQGTANQDFDDYADEVTVWFGSTKVAEADASDFDDENGYAKTLSLTSNAVIEAGEKENFYVAVSGANNIDGNDIGETWTVDIPSVRWMDAQGGLISEDPNFNMRTFSFESFGTANSLELKVNLATSNPDTQVVAVDDINDTNNVLLLRGTFEAQGGEMRLRDVPMTVGYSSTISGIAKNFMLIVDGNTVDSIDASDCDTGTCTFADADFDLDADDTVDFEIRADLNDTGGTFAEGDYLSASITSANADAINADDENGDDVSNISGSANGKNQLFWVAFPQITVESTSIVPNDNGSAAPNSATATMRLKIVAKGGNLYLNGDDEGTANKEFFQIAVEGGSGGSTTTISSYSFTPSGTYTVTNSGAEDEYYTVNENNTMYVDITAIVTQANNGGTVLAGMRGSSILFGTAATSDTTRSANSLSYTALTDMLKTGKTTITD